MRSRYCLGAFLGATVLPMLLVDCKGYYYKPYTAEDLEGKLLYAHMSKTGGTQILQILRQSVQDEKRAWHSEAHGLNDAHRAAYVIGSIRNPCDYYVSLWAFQSTSVGTKVGLMADMLRREPQSYARLVGKNEAAAFSTPDDIQRFRAWVAYISKTDYGYLSARFFRKYVEHIPIGGSSVDMKSNAYLVRNLTDTEVSEQLEQLEAANVSSLASCWVKTENLSDDLVLCLEKFQKVAGGKAADPEKARTLLGKSRKNGRTVNRSPHGPCKDYFDEETAAMVQKMDRHIFEKFGYTKCCKEKGAASSSDLEL